MPSMIGTMVEQLVAEFREKLLAELRAEIGADSPPQSFGRETISPKLTRREMARRIYQQESGAEVPASRIAPLRVAGLADGSVAPKRRRRRHSRPSKLYTLVNTRRNASEPTIHQSALSVWKALRKADQSLSAKDLESATGLGRKTVESSLWFLRNHDSSGVRISPRSPNTIVKAIANDGE